MQISQTVFELLIGRRLLHHFQMAPPGATGWSNLLPIFKTNLPCVKEYLPTKFYADISNGFRVVDRTSFVTPHAKPNKRNMSPPPLGDRGHNYTVKNIFLNILYINLSFLAPWLFFHLHDQVLPEVTV